MTVDSFIAIRWPLKHRIVLRKRVIYVLIGCAWVIAIVRGFIYLLVTLPNLFEIQSIFESFGWVSDDYCMLRSFFVFKSDTADKAYVYSFFPQELFTTINIAIFLTILFVVFITVVSIYCYRSVVIYRLAVQRSNQLHLQRAQGAHQQQQPVSIQRQQTKSLLTTIILVISFTVLWMPLTVFQLLRITNDNIRRGLELIEPGYIERVLMIVCSSTSLVDVFICMYFLRPLKLRVCMPCFERTRNNIRSPATTSTNAGLDHSSSKETPA